MSVCQTQTVFDGQAIDQLKAPRGAAVDFHGAHTRIAAKQGSGASGGIGRLVVYRHHQLFLAGAGELNDGGAILSHDLPDVTLVGLLGLPLAAGHERQSGEIVFKIFTGVGEL